MGLCKCPKKRVTNQFCFEHRVNVCEHCLVMNHPKCVVQSYLQWLQDSDCNPICTLCSGSLSEGDCVRLTCYHVYHWACIDTYCRNLPAITAPAGYTCPTCQAGIFPKANLVSPVADVLREKLAGVNWARAGLGLPLLSEDREQRPVQERKVPVLDASPYQNHTNTTSSPTVATSRVNSNINSANTNTNNIHSNNQKLGPPYSVVNVEPSLPLLGQTPRKIFEAYDDPKNITFDHDENKYQRKSAIEWFLRWWKLITRSQSRKRHVSGSAYKTYAMVGVVVLFVFIGIIIIFSWLGRMATDGDPSFNPLSNPNIFVGRDPGN
ncbi:zinc finger protein-like 1 [Cephus cinctus]|uniref:Zinc finger protein-like 1 homolog n=1 Tax=Cephus cinctus TaxID=211228 RepID=A0AAJ7FCX5_CEPCN|nr:zinc finger protein-like 1 [Cephus cinctus]